MKTIQNLNLVSENIRTHSLIWWANIWQSVSHHTLLTDKINQQVQLFGTNTPLRIIVFSRRTTKNDKSKQIGSQPKILGTSRAFDDKILQRHRMSIAIAPLGIKAKDTLWIKRSWKKPLDSLSDCFNKASACVAALQRNEGPSIQFYDTGLTPLHAKRWYCPPDLD